MTVTKTRALPKASQAVLAYLQNRMPAYPFDATIDAEFVGELTEDFADIDILEETKSFRWFYCQQPPQRRSIRLSLRRWIANASRRQSTGKNTRSRS